MARSGRSLDLGQEKKLRGVEAGEARALGIHGGASRTQARAGELRVAALLVREEAEAVSRRKRNPAESKKGLAGPPPLRAQA